MPKLVTKPNPKWVTTRNKTVHQKHFQPPKTKTGHKTDGGDATGVSISERRRQDMVRARNRARTMSWMVSFLVAVVATLGSGYAWLFGTLDVAASSVAAVFAGLVLAAGAAGGVKTHKAGYHRYLPDVAAATVAAAITVWWVTTSWWSWLALGWWLVATLATGWRWRSAHPIGPGVPTLAPPVVASEDTGVHADPNKAAKPQPLPVDQYIQDWNDYIAQGETPLLPGSALTISEVTEYTRVYEVELVRVLQTIRKLLSLLENIASGLGVTHEQVIIEGIRGRANYARLTIITKDPVAESRFYTGPNVQDGRILGLARYRDGKGEAGVTIWNGKGTRALAIVGSTGGGKSAFANAVVCGAMSTGVLNLIYADPKGNSSGALVDRARIAIIGEEAALRAPELLQVIIDARVKYSTTHRRDLLFPTPELPGWIYLHDEMSVVLKGNRKVQQRHAKQANIVRSLGVWCVTMNQSLAVEDWGSDHARAAYTTQAVAFYVNSKSGDKLIPGLDYRPNQLPLDDDGEPVPGMAIFARTGRSNVPARCDWLPTDDDMVKQGGKPIEPPYRTSSAFDAFFNPPDMAKIDYDALVAAYGPPVNGRWVFGPGGTHEFPESSSRRSSREGAVSTSGGDDDWSRLPDVDDGLNRKHRFLVQLISEGVHRPADMKDAVTEAAKDDPGVRMAHTTLHKHLGELVERQIVEQPRQGVYVLAGSDADGLDWEDEEDDAEGGE